MSDNAAPDATPLSPAEATVLLAPNMIKPMRAIKATLLLMLTTGVLRLEQSEQPGVFRTRKVAHLRVAAAPKNPPPEVAALIAVVRAAQADGGKIADVVKECERAFGAMGAKFTANFVVPALIARGLLRQKKFLFLTGYFPTPAGEKAQARLKSDLFKAEDAARLLKSDPAQAAALAATLGTTVLLSDKLTRKFKPLADAMRAAASGGADGADGAAGFEVSDIHRHHHALSGGSAGFDLGSFDLGNLDLGNFDLGNFDLGALGSAIESFESGFSDSGGHDGGGDGGGGGHH